MKRVGEIYEAYKIMPNLQLHQLRVAGVARIICEHFDEDVDQESVVVAALFHDMGNIIKSDLDVFPQFVESKGRAYWQQVKDDMIATYGEDEHYAALAIAQEIGLPEKACLLIDDTRFSRLEAARDGDDFEQKILKYADLRVGPYGVLSLAARLEEGRQRYAHKKGYDTAKGREEFERSKDAAFEIEEQLFSRSSIRPSDIHDENVAPRLEELRNWEVV